MRKRVENMLELAKKTLRAHWKHLLSGAAFSGVAYMVMGMLISTSLGWRIPILKIGSQFLIFATVIWIIPEFIHRYLWERNNERYRRTQRIRET